VVLGLETDAAVRRAFDSVTAAAGLMNRPDDSRESRPLDVRGVLVEPQAQAGIELIVGAKRDAQYGPLVLVGLGGILAEALDDVAVRLAPVSSFDALAMIKDLRGAAILEGRRGRPAADLEAVADLIVALGRAITDHPDWREVDLNPVIVGAKGALAVDALIVVEPPESIGDKGQ
jgi:acetyltransferase